MTNNTAAAVNQTATEESLVAIYDTHEGAELAVRSLPVSGPFLIMGPLVGMILSATAGATVGGMGGVLAGVLANAGIPDESVVAYQLELTAGRYLVMVQGPADVVQHAQSVVAESGARQVRQHDARGRFATRAQVLDLLSDEEVAQVSVAEVDGQIAEGEEYVDLLRLDRGIRRALDGSSAGGRLAKNAVEDATWVRITSLFNPVRSRSGHATLLGSA